MSICVEDDEPPFGFVRIDGIAELSDDRDELLSWTTRIAARYMGDDRAEEFGRRNAAPSEMLGCESDRSGSSPRSNWPDELASHEESAQTRRDCGSAP